MCREFQQEIKTPAHQILPLVLATYRPHAVMIGSIF